MNRQIGKKGNKITAFILLLCGIFLGFGFSSIFQMQSIEFYRNSEKLGSRFNFDFEKFPSKFTKPF